MERDALIDRLWQAASEKLFITREQFVASLDGWTVEPLDVDGAVAFIVLTKGPEFHYYSLDTGRPWTMKLVRSQLQPIIDRYGHVCTKTPKRETRQRRFNELIGFRVHGEDEFNIHFRMDKLRSHACPSSP